MSRLSWGQATNRRYEAGIDRGVFYPANGPGEVWNGLTAVQESPSDTEVSYHQIDGVRVQKRRRPGEFAGTIEAYTYPDSFYENVLTPRRPKPFGLSYRVRTSKAYKIHIVYNVSLTPTAYTYAQDDVNAFSWEFTTKPIHFPDVRPTAHLIVDASDAYSTTVAALEEILYGSASANARLPTALDILEVFEENSILRIIDHGDGTWTAIGPDDVISMLDPDTFQIDWPSAEFIDADTYTIRSL